MDAVLSPNAGLTLPHIVYNVIASGCSSVRLERTVRDREVGGSNPPTPTTPTIPPRRCLPGGICMAPLTGGGRLYGSRGWLKEVPGGND